MKSVHSRIRRLALCTLPILVASLVGCGGGGGGGGGGSSGGGSSSSSGSSSGSATAYVGGTEFLVNSGVDNDQSNPRATTLNNGNLAIVWETKLGTIGGIPLAEVRAQIFNTDSAKVGSEILASSGTADSSLSHRHLQPTIAPLSTGGFGIVYLSNGHNSGTTGVTDGPLFAREFSTNGTALTDAVVPPLTYIYNGQLMGAAGRQSRPELITLTGGRLLLTWTDMKVVDILGGDGDSLTVKAQLFSADADELSPAFIVNTATLGQQSWSRATALSNGGFVITWLDYNGSNSSTPVIKLKAQIYDAAGQVVGPEFVVKDSPNFLQSTGSVAALANGQFVVAWSEGVSGSSPDDEAYAQIFDAGGARLGGVITLPTTTNGRQIVPEVVSLPNGHFVAAWGDTSATLGDTDGFALKGQAFTANGTRFSPEFIVNVNTTGNQTNLALTPLKTNGFLVTWIDNSATLGDTSGTSIKGRIFKLN